MFRDFIMLHNHAPLCEAHARQYYGNQRIDELIGMKQIKAWKVSTEKKTVQPELSQQGKETE